MTTNIKATGLTLTSEVSNYLDKCLHKVEMYVKGESAAKVTVELERISSHDQGETFRCELTIRGGGISVRAESEENTLHAAIDVLEGRAIGELRKVKGKKLHSLRRQAKRVKDFVRGWRN